MKMLLGLLRLRQVCCDLRLLDRERDGDAAESAKLELLDELLEEAIDGGHRVLVFSQFVSMLALIRAATGGEVDSLRLPRRLRRKNDRQSSISFQTTARSRFS